MSEEREPLNLYFRLVVVASVCFAITVLILFALTMSTSEAPIEHFFSANAGWMVGVEVAAILIFGFLAMAVDRRQTLRKMEERAAEILAQTATETTEPTPSTGNDDD